MKSLRQGRGARARILPLRALAAVPVLAVAGMLGGCATGPYTPLGPVPPGSHWYQLGYEQGCKSAIANFTDQGYAGYWKLWHRYRTDPEYHKGWDEGFQHCTEQERLHPPMMHSGSGGREN